MTLLGSADDISEERGTFPPTLGFSRTDAHTESPRVRHAIVPPPSGGAAMLGLLGAHSGQQGSSCFPEGQAVVRTNAQQSLGVRLLVGP